MIHSHDMQYRIPSEIKNERAQKKIDQIIQDNWFPRNINIAARFLAEKILKPSDKILLRPPGTHTASILASLKDNALYSTIIGCLEKEITSSYIHPNLQQPVYPLTELKNIDFDYIIISHLLYENQMRDELLSLGVPTEKIILIYQNPKYHDFIKTEISHKIQTCQPAKKQKPRIVWIPVVQAKMISDYAVEKLSANHFEHIELMFSRTTAYTLSDTPIHPYLYQFDCEMALGLLIPMIQKTDPDLIIIQDCLFPTYNSLSVILKSFFPELKIITALYDPFYTYFDYQENPSENYNINNDELHLFLEGEKYSMLSCNGWIHNLNVSGVNFVESRVPGSSKTQFEWKQYYSSKYHLYKTTTYSSPLKLVSAHQFGSRHTVMTLNKHGDYLPVYQNLLHQGFDITHYISYLKPEEAITTYPEWFDLDKQNLHFHLLPGIAQFDLIREINQKYDFALMLYNDEFEGIFCMYNQMKYATGSRIFAYIAAGIPIIISSCVESLADIIREFEIGIVVNSQERKNLQQVIQQYDYQKMIHNMGKAQKHFSLENNIERLRDFLKERV